MGQWVGWPLWGRVRVGSSGGRVWGGSSGGRVWGGSSGGRVWGGSSGAGNRLAAVGQGMGWPQWG